MSSRQKLVPIALVLVLALPGCKKMLRKFAASRFDAGAVGSISPDPVDDPLANGNDPLTGDPTGDPLEVGKGGKPSSVAAYRSTSGGFSIRFPGGRTPDLEDKPIAGGLVTLHFFKSQKGSSAYIVGYNELPKSGRTAKQVLDDARDGAIESIGATLEKEIPLTIDGNPGREVVMTAEKSGINLRQRLRMYIVKSRLYQTIAVSPTFAPQPADEQDFLDSFTLLKSGATK